MRSSVKCHSPSRRWSSIYKGSKVKCSFWYEKDVGATTVSRFSCEVMPAANVIVRSKPALFQLSFMLISMIAGISAVPRKIRVRSTRVM